MPTELDDEVGEAIRATGHEFGTTTGRPRRCGWFDAVAGRHSVRVNGFNSIAVTRLDILDDLPSLKICTAYEIDGTELEEFPARTELLARCQPVYEELEGWRENTSSATAWDQLPPAAQHYVERLSQMLGIPVGVIGVGEDRSQSIQLREYP
jgi:adenylosuccinate synthase